MKIQRLFSLIVVLLALHCASSQEIFKDVVLQTVERNINAQTQLLRIETMISFKNERDAILKDFYFAIPNDYEPYLKHFVVLDKSGHEIPFLPYDNLKLQSQISGKLFKINLDPPMKPGDSRQIATSEVYFGRMEPLPKRITLHVIWQKYETNLIGRSKGCPP